jgi:hypothetical protein
MSLINTVEVGRDLGEAYDLNAVLHPASVFSHPREVVADQTLSVQEKRAILSSWASDACALESVPELRCAPGAAQAVRFDDIIDALQSLDPPWHPSQSQGSKPRRSRKWWGPRRGSSSEQTGQSGLGL